VFNAGMHRTTYGRIACAALAAVLLAPAAAGAAIIEVGEIPAKSTPSCPAAPCQAISRTTAYQVKVGPDRKSFAVPRAGKIVAWSVTLGKPAAKQREFFEGSLGGEAQAGITILKRGKRLRHQVLGASPVQTLTPFFGQTVQFPLDRALNVTRGNIVALTVPTWAPALALGLGRDTAWRASRPDKRCGDTTTQTMQTRVRSITQYRCLYQTARLTYSATLITNPVAPTPPPRARKPPEPRR
jgi:hypothetical protein